MHMIKLNKHFILIFSKEGKSFQPEHILQKATKWDQANTKARK